MALVVELEPGCYATEPRPLPETADWRDWQRYWAACLADAGIESAAPIRPGGWMVRVDTLGRDALPIVVRGTLAGAGIPGFPDDNGEIEPDPGERIGALDGGVALFDGDALVIEPRCCGDLGNVAEWREALTDTSGDWSDLWIGHPWPMTRIAGGFFEIRAPEEAGDVAVARDALLADLEIVEARQRQLALQLEAALAELAELDGTGLDRGALARLLAGL